MATRDFGGVINPLPKIDSLPNLRLLCKRSTSSAEASALSNSAAIYRSSKPDRIVLNELDEFRQLGIKCIIDFRSAEEYLKTDGHRLLDKEYSLYEVLLPKENYKPGQSVKCQLVTQKDSHGSSSNQNHEDSSMEPNARKSNDDSSQNCEQSGKRHFLINFFSMKYVLTVFKRLPWHLWCLGILHILWDLIARNKLLTFRRFFGTKAIGSGGIFGQYVDIIEVSQPAICAALKLVSDPNNLPALINCAFGKDRTGIMSALILTCLGMPKEYVAEEYSMSTEGLEPVKHLMYRDIVERHFLKEEFCKSESNTMRDLLTYIEDRYVSVERYMVSIGFTEEEQAKLKGTLEAFNHKPIKQVS